MIAIGLLALIGIALAVIERNFLEHDFNRRNEVQTESDRQLIRTCDEISAR